MKGKNILISSLVLVLLASLIVVLHAASTVMTSQNSTTSMLSGSIQSIFTESGLPQGSNWSVTYDSEFALSNKSEIYEYTQPGTYFFTIPNHVVGNVTYAPNVASGNLTAGDTIEIVFSLLSSTNSTTSSSSTSTLTTTIITNSTTTITNTTSSTSTTSSTTTIPGFSNATKASQITPNNHVQNVGFSVSNYTKYYVSQTSGVGPAVFNGTVTRCAICHTANTLITVNPNITISVNSMALGATAHVAFYNSTGHFSTEGLTSHLGVFTYNVSISSNSPVTVIFHYSPTPLSLAPFILQDDVWIQVSPNNYTINQTADTITFIAPSDPTFTVGTTTSTSAFGEPYRNIFYANTLWWYFYYAGAPSNVVYTTSASGVAWSPTNSVFSAAQPIGAWDVSNTSSSACIAMAVGTTGFNTLCGTLNSNGIVSWGTATSVTTTNTLNTNADAIRIGQDTSGNLWVEIVTYNGNYYTEIWEYSGGTWTKQYDGFTHSISLNNLMEVLTLPSGDMAFVNGNGNSGNGDICVNTWNGFTVNTATCSPSAYVTGGVSADAVAVGSNVYIAGQLNSGTNPIEFFHCSFPCSTLTATNQIASSSKGDGMVGISTDNRKNLTVVYDLSSNILDYLTTNNLGGTSNTFWTANAPLVSNEIAIRADVGAVSQNYVDGNFAVAWESGAASPYILRFEWTVNTIVATPNPPFVSNAVIDVGQISVVNTLITGGINGYTSNWFWSSTNTISGTTTGSTSLFTISNAVPSNIVLVFNAVSSNQINLGEGGSANTLIPVNVLTSLTPVMNNALGVWTIKALVIDNNGLGSNGLITSVNTITVHSALVAGLPGSTNALPIAATTNIVAHPSGGTPPYAYNWFYGTSSTCSSDSLLSGVTTSTFSTSNTGVYCYEVTDSASTPVSVYSATISVANVLDYVPITFTNYQAEALASNTPLAVGVTSTSISNANVIGVNALSYSRYYTCNLNNAEFFYANGTIATSWLEGNYLYEQYANSVCTGSTSTNALVSSANILYWVLPSNDLAFLPANTGTATTNVLDLGWVGNTITATNTLFQNKTGEAPQLSCGSSANVITPASTCLNYGQYDNGADVFNVLLSNGELGLYQNFAASSCPLAWTCSGSIENNGFVVYSPATSANYIEYLPTSLPSVTANMVLGFYGGLYNGIGGSTSNEMFAGYGNIGSGIIGGEYIYGPTFAEADLHVRAVRTAALSLDISSLAGNRIWESTINSTNTIGTNTMTFYINYNTIFIASSATAVPLYSEEDIVFYDAASLESPIGPIYWVRTRINPPANQLPTTSFGAVVPISPPVTTNQLVATPNPYTISNKSISVGQISIANTIISNGITGTTSYTGNWVWIAPTSSNIATANTIFALLPTSNNALTLTINAFSSNQLSLTFNGVTYWANAIGTNTIYGTWTFNAYATDSNGDLSPTPVLTNTLTINRATFFTQNTLPLGVAWNTTYNGILEDANAVLPWAASANTYPIDISYQSCPTYNGYIYCVSGFNGITDVNSAYYASLSSTGTSAWGATTPYPMDMTGQTCSTSNNYIYCVGGNDNNGTTWPSVYYAPISSSGVGTWTLTSPYPTNIQYESCPTYNGFIYCVGGTNTIADINSVYYASISSSGVGTWTATNSYPFSVGLQSCSPSNGFIYCVGGVNSIRAANAVYYASISSSGVGTWTATNAYPTNVYNQICPSYNNYIYCVGGFNSTVTINSVYYASLSSTGTSVWTATNAFPFITYSNDCSPSNGFIYCVGGVNSLAYTLPTYYAPLDFNTIPFSVASGTYSFSVANQLFNNSIYVPTPSSGTFTTGGTQYISFAPQSTSICTISLSNSLINFGSISPSLNTPTSNAVTDTNSGSGSAYLYVYGTNWISTTSTTANFLVQNTLWSTASQGFYTGTPLTLTPVNTFSIVASSSGTNTLYFGTAVPNGEPSNVFAQNIIIENVC